MSPAALPVMLQIHAISISIGWMFPDKLQDVSAESLWTRFAETALKFAHLQHVKLLLELEISAPGLTFVWEPAPAGITDETFKSLIVAEKFRCEAVYRYKEEIVLTATDRVDPRPPADQADQATSTDSAGSSEAESESESDSDSDVVGGGKGARGEKWL